MPDILVILRGSLAVQNENTISSIQDPHYSLEKQTIKTFSHDTTNDTITGPREGHLSFFEQSFDMFLINKKWSADDITCKMEEILGSLLGWDAGMV